MNNYITASIIFCFKGVNHSPSLTVDLDQHMAASGSIPNLYPLIARANQLDLYSYEYEIMQLETIHFNNPQGMVAEHINEHNLDIKAFESAWHESKIIAQLQEIIKHTLSVSDLNQHPNLMDALMQSYNLGKNTINNKC